MVIIIKYPLLVVLLWIGVAVAQKNCCKEGVENFLTNGRCEDGSVITGITCKQKYKIDDGKFTISTKQELIDDPINIPYNEYCLTREEKNGPLVAIVCVPAENAEIESASTFYIFRAICEIISVVFLVLTLAVYILVPQMRDLQGKCLMCLISALAISMLSLGLMQLGVYVPDPFCYIVGFITYTTFIATFAWLNVVSFHIFRITVEIISLGTKRQWEIIYSIYGFGVPILFLIISLISNHVPGTHDKPRIGEGSCWFIDRKATWIYFYGPIAVMLIINMIFFSFTLLKLWGDAKTVTQSNKLKCLRYKCLLYIKLFFIMGLSWSFEIISFAVDTQHNPIDYIWMVTDFINAIQGVLIFLILVIFRKRALKGLANKGLFCVKLPTEWKSLHDEECDEDNEEEYIPKEYIYEKKLNDIKEKPNNEV